MSHLPPPTPTPLLPLLYPPTRRLRHRQMHPQERLLALQDADEEADQLPMGSEAEAAPWQEQGGDADDMQPEPSWGSSAPGLQLRREPQPYVAVAARGAASREDPRDATRAQSAPSTRAGRAEAAGRSATDDGYCPPARGRKKWTLGPGGARGPDEAAPPQRGGVPPHPARQPPPGVAGGLGCVRGAALGGSIFGVLGGWAPRVGRASECVSGAEPSVQTAGGGVEQLGRQSRRC